MNIITSALGFVTGGNFSRMGATLLVGVAVGGWAVHKIEAAAYAHQEIQRQRAVLVAIEAAQAETTRLQEKTDAAIETATQTAQANARAAAGARTQLERLRSAQRDAASAATSCPAIAHRANTLDTVFGQCAEALVEMGRAADGHATDAVKLHRAWPRPP